MDDSSIYNDEVIPGSDEEEDSLIPPISCQNDHSLFEDRISHASTQDTIQSPFDATMLKRSPVSSISDETTGSSSATNPRLLKRTDISSSNSSRQEKTATFSDIPVDIDYTMSIDIAERAKIRSRNKQQTQQPIISKNDIIELSSDDDDDDFTILPLPKRRKTIEKTKIKLAKKNKSNSETAVDAVNPKPRPRPRPLKRSIQAANTEEALPGGITTHEDSIPTSPTSNDAFTVHSQLPPSDPPSSTASSYDHPPITTLPQMSADYDSSSPPSRFSSAENHRKFVMSHVDELGSEPDQLASGTVDSCTYLMPPPPLPGPPPTFFATSSPAQETTPTTSGTKALIGRKSRKKKPGDDDDSVLEANGPKARAKQKRIPAKKVEGVVKQPKAKSKGKEKEIFQSRELIDDVDDDCTSDKVSATLPSTSKKPEPLNSLISIPEYDTDSPANAKSSKNRRFVDQEDDELDAIGRSTSSSGYQRRAVGRDKRVIDSDNDYLSPQLVEATSSPTAAPKAKSQDKPLPAKQASKFSPCTNVEINGVTNLKQQTGNEKEPYSSASSKENALPSIDIPRTPKASVGPGVSCFPSLSSRYTIGPRTKSTPMSDLIRRVNSKPGSPFCSPAPRSGGASSATPGTAYSPYAKASRTTLSRIAPLHPNRRTPPPPLPPPPPKKKTKKEIEREEQWEEELIDSVGGITEWACMSDAERAEMRKAKREREMSGWED
ncbi:hypothetical protein C0993_007829 [Termitomyces sp. T159_Od127]|nr:hypothetical protein C0993_007829 [Termitomyces sp. T159_Od127]